LDLDFVTRTRRFCGAVPRRMISNPENYSAPEVGLW